MAVHYNSRPGSFPGASISPFSLGSHLILVFPYLCETNSVGLVMCFLNVTQLYCTIEVYCTMHRGGRRGADLLTAFGVAILRNFPGPQTMSEI